MYLHGLRRLRSFKWQNRAICSCMMAQVKSPWLLLPSRVLRVWKNSYETMYWRCFFLKKIHTRLRFGAVLPGKIHTRLCLLLFYLEKFIRDYVWCYFTWKNSYETMFGAILPGKIHTRLFGAILPGKIHTRLCLVLFYPEKFIRDYVWCYLTGKNSYETMFGAI